MRVSPKRSRRLQNRLSFIVSLLVSAVLVTTSFIQVTTAQKAGKAGVRQSKPRVVLPPTDGSQKILSQTKAEISRSPENETTMLRARPSKDEDTENKATRLAGIAPKAVMSETESNDTPATAQPLGTTPVRVRGDLYRAPFSAGVDVDFYSFTALANDKVYAATMTGFSGGSTDTVIDIIASDGTTVLESDDEDGTIGGSASNIAGTLLATAGTYYVRVRQFTTTSLTGTIRPYDLYVRVLSGAPTAETEPNNNGAPQALAPNGWMSGAITPLNDNDTYAVSANSGDTIVVIMDVDPERDTPEWNGRVGIGLFNNFFLLANGSAVGGTFDDVNPSEALFITVETTGAYQIYVDESPTNPAATGAATNTYHISVSVIPGNVPAGTCTSYAGTGGAITDAATTDFTLNVPGARIIESLQLKLDETHAAGATAELDVSLIAPDGNEVVLFDDPPGAAGAAAPQIDLTLDDHAGIPISLFGVHRDIQYTPELYARLAYFKGQQAQGTWTLRVRDDTAGNTGTLNAWGINVCEAPPAPTCPSPITTVYTNDFEASDGGFTHSGTEDEWERGLPSFAPITTCHSGTNCWKSDLDNTYNASANFDLLSPNIDLTAVNGVIKLRWWQKYQMESASFDSMWVEVRQVGVPASARKVFEWKGSTMTRSVGTPAGTVQMSAGWGLVEADISSFAGQNVEVRYHIETDSTGQFAGLAVDDVSVTACPAAPAGLGDVKISEFRYNGPNGASDEFIELYNNTDSPIVVLDSGAGTGWALVSADNTAVAKAIIPNGTTIPARGHFLVTNSAGYSLGQYPSGNNGAVATTATGDLTYATDIPINRGIALFRTSVAAAFTGTADRLDAVGPASETQPAGAPYREGTGLPDIAAIASDYSWARRLPGGCTGTRPGFVNHNCTTAAQVAGTPASPSGNVQDTNNNVTDFIFVDVNGTATPVGNQRLGAPGPENLSSPIQRNATIKASLIDPTQASSAPPNRVRDPSGVTNGPFGTLDIRRKFTNNTGAPVTRLRFRVMDISTFPPLNDTGTANDAADLRALSSTATIAATAAGPVTVEGTTLEEDTTGNPGQPLGGAFNSSLAAGTVTLATPIAPGASINLRFVFGVTQGGAFRVFINVEALP